MSKNDPQVRRLFSEREVPGLMRQTVQSDSMTSKLSNMLRNAIIEHNRKVSEYSDSVVGDLVRAATDTFFRQAADECFVWSIEDRRLELQRRWVSFNSEWEGLDWYTRYDLVELYLSVFDPKPLVPALLSSFSVIGNPEGERRIGLLLRPLEDAYSGLVRQLSDVLSRECSTFRVVDGLLTRIVDDVEIDAVDDALAALEPFSEARGHLRKAIGFLGSREEPDYANAVSEAVRAVEGVAKVLTRDSNATLGPAFKVLKSPDKDRQGLYKGFEAIFGFSSNVARHAQKQGGALPTEAEARAIVVTSSAITNYLIATHATTTNAANE